MNAEEVGCMEVFTTDQSVLLSESAVTDGGTLCTTVTSLAASTLDCQSMCVCSTNVSADGDTVDVEIVKAQNGNYHMINAHERILIMISVSAAVVCLAMVIIMHKNKNMQDTEAAF